MQYLKQKHLQEMITVQTGIANNSLFEHFTICREYFTLICNYCFYSEKISLIEINHLKLHYQHHDGSALKS